MQRTHARRKVKKCPARYSAPPPAKLSHPLHTTAECFLIAAERTRRRRSKRYRSKPKGLRPSGSHAGATIRIVDCYRPKAASRDRLRVAGAAPSIEGGNLVAAGGTHDIVCCGVLVTHRSVRAGGERASIDMSVRAPRFKIRQPWLSVRGFRASQRGTAIPSLYEAAILSLAPLLLRFTLPGSCGSRMRQSINS